MYCIARRHDAACSVIPLHMKESTRNSNLQHLSESTAVLVSKRVSGRTRGNEQTTENKDDRSLTACQHSGRVYGCDEANATEDSFPNAA